MEFPQPPLFMPSAWCFCAVYELHNHVLNPCRERLLGLASLAIPGSVIYELCMALGKSVHVQTICVLLLDNGGHDYIMEMRTGLKQVCLTLNTVPSP